MPRTLPIALVLLLVWAAEAGADAFEREWCTIESTGFRLVTDRGRDEAEDMVRWLRAFRPAAERYLPGTPNRAELPLTITVFSRLRDFRRALGTGALAGFMQPSLNENLMVVGPDHAARREHETLLHEYVHYLLRTRRGVNLPAWLDEGLAGMLSSAVVTEGEVRIGQMPVSDLRRMMQDSGVSVGETLRAGDVSEWPLPRQRGFYAWSWLLVNWLLLGRDGADATEPRALETFLSGTGGTLTGALGLSETALERALERHLERRTPTAAHRVPEQTGAPSAFRCLDESEKMYRLSLAMVAHNPEGAAERLRKRLTADAGNAELWMALSLAEEHAGNADATLDAARRAHAMAPGVSTAVRLAGALAVGCIVEASERCRARWQEAVPLLRTALRRDPTRHDAIFTLGLAYLYSGRPGDSLNYLRIAHRRQPWAPHVNFYLGESYRLVGDSRARAHLERARQWSPMAIWRKLADAALEMLGT